VTDLGAFSMWELFRTEVESQAQTLTDSLLLLEQEPGAAAHVAPAMRAAHSIKGAARIVEMDLGVRLAHAMEDCLVGAQEGAVTLGPAGIDILLKGVDLLSQTSKLEEAEVPGWMESHAGEADRLIGLLEAVRAGRATDIVKAAVDVPVADAPESAEPQVATVSSPVAPAPPAPVPGIGVSPPSAPAPAASASRPPSSGDARTVRVGSQTLNRLMGLAGESLVQSRWLEPFSESLLGLKKRHQDIMTALDDVRDLVRPLSSDAVEQLHRAIGLVDDARQWAVKRQAALDTFANQSVSLSDRLYREVIASRMRPFGDGVEGFPRLVRDVARQLGKQITLVVEGRSTGVDRDVLDRLEAPLNHAIRNAIDHGIEPPDERVAAGKSPTGTIRLEARHRAGLLFVTVADDGRGVDLQKLRAAIVRKGLATADMAEHFSEAELLEFLFLPGFSTASAVTDISGRGVGMDAVQDMAKSVGGAARLSTKLGHGMTLHLELPLTLSVVRTLLVEIAGEPYAFPLTRIDRVSLVPREALEALGGYHYATIDRERVGIVPASEVFEIPGGQPSSNPLRLILIGDRTNRYGLVVDRFLGEHDLVIKPLDPRLGKVRDVSAAAVLKDGSPVLVVDVDDLMRSIETLLHGGRLRGLGGEVAASAHAAPRKRILVVDDSLTVREVERKLLENGGYDVDVAVDGMDGWNSVRVGHYDLVVTDVDMPRMNGIELVTKIKGDARLTSIPVMIVSYKDREEDRLRGLQAGANHYLTKSSFHDESLLAAVADLIGAPRS
jgi:two-component system sensor histidine kinase and response regulator WspE